MHMNTQIKDKFEAYEIAKTSTLAERAEYAKFYQSLARAAFTQRNAINDRIDPVFNAEWERLDAEFERLNDIVIEFENYED
jgi:hypothetical protein